MNITIDNNKINKSKANENNKLNKSYSLNKSMNHNLLTNSANKSIFNDNKTNALEKLLEYTNLVELEKYYFPFNKDKDLKKIQELGKIFRIGVHQFNSPFFENYTNKINYIEDCRRVPYFNSNLEKFIDNNKNDKNVGYIDSLSFKDKIEKLQHPNIIRPSAFFQLNMAKINREIKLKEKNLKESSLIREKKSKRLNHNDSKTKLRKMFTSQIDENLDEDMIKFFKYDKLKYLDNVLFEKGRAVEIVLNMT